MTKNKKNEWMVFLYRKPDVDDTMEVRVGGTVFVYAGEIAAPALRLQGAPRRAPIEDRSHMQDVWKWVGFHLLRAKKS